MHLRKLGSPSPTTFYLCGKEVCEKVFCFRQQELPCTQDLAEKKKRLFSANIRDQLECRAIVWLHRGQFGRVAECKSMEKELGVSPSILYNHLRISLQCVPSMQGSMSLCSNLKNPISCLKMCLLFRNKLLEIQEAWASESCTASIRPWAQEQTWPWWLTALFRRKMLFSRKRYAAGFPLPLWIVHYCPPQLWQPMPSSRECSWKNLNALEPLKRQREGGRVKQTQLKVFCIELDGQLLFVYYVF